MTIEKLEAKIAELLNTDDSDKSAIFLLFKRKLVECLNIGEALKLNNLGVFQLKEQISSNNKSENEVVLIFSPENKGKKKESLFLTIEVNANRKKITEFDEKVFSIGIGKPILPIGILDKDGDGVAVEISLEEKITDLISISEKVENFDLWDDYLDGKQSTISLMDVEEESGDLDKYLQDESVSPNPSDFIEINEEELLAEFENSEIFNDNKIEVEELLDTISSVDDQALVEAVSSENIIENIEEVNNTTILKDELAVGEFRSIESEIEENLNISKLNDELIEDEVKVDNNYEEKKTKTKILTEDVLEEKTIEILEEVLAENEELISDFEEISDETKNKFYNDEENDTVEEEVEIEKTNNYEEDVLPELNNEQNNTQESTAMAHPGMKNFKKGYSPTIIALIVAFFIVGAIGLYYLFFDNPTWLYDPNEVEISLSEKHTKEFEEAKRKALKLEETKGEISEAEKDTSEKGVNTLKQKEKTIVKSEESKKAEKTNSSNNTITSKKNKVKKNKKVSKPKVIKSKSNNSKKVFNNIFFDGTSYSIQISSWRDIGTAEKEAARIRKKGYSTYVMEAFIPKYNSNWYRVRIGDVATLDKAKSIQQTVK